MSLRLRSNVSPAALQTIREAFEDLERIVTPVDAKEFGQSTLQNVQAAALAIENQLGARQSLRNMRRIMPLFSGLQHYSKSIEVLCNGTPFLPWVWAPIKVILTAASDYVDAFQEIIKHYAHIGEALARFERLHTVFNTNQEFQNVLAVFYSDILRYHREAYQFVRRRSWKLFFSTSFGRFQRRFDDIIISMRAHEELLDKTANAINIVEASQMRAELRQKRQDKLAEMDKDESHKALEQYRDILAWLKIDQSEQSLILDCITEESERFPGGCDWVLKNGALVSWLQSTPASPFVWLQGKPGSGKSVLAAKIIAFLRVANHSLVVSHFCTYSYASSTIYDGILCSLLLQLIQGNPDLIAYLCKLKDTEFAKRPVTSLSLERLIGALAPVLSKNPGETKYVHLVVDGLDECEEGKRDRLVALLERLVSTSGPSSPSVVCKLLLLSRHSDAFARRMRQKTIVSLTEQKRHVNQAIQCYARRRLESLRPCLDEMDVGHEDIESMARTLAEKADGMFLWARLVLQFIEQNMFYTKEEILTALHSLPRELSEFYEKILSQIMEGFNALSTQRLKSVFGWIAYAKRPLKEFELQSALAFGSGDMDVSKVAPSHIFTKCGPLIEKRNDSTYSFIHVSLKSYLQHEDNGAFISEAGSSLEHSIALTTCLLSGKKVFGTGFPDHERRLRVVHGLHAFQIYATEYWLDHLLIAGACEGGFERSPKLCSILSGLSSALEEQPFHQKGAVRDSSFLEAQIQCLRDRRGVYEAAKDTLAGRLTRNIANPTPSNSASGHAQTSSLGQVLASYQRTVQSLLVLRVFPGVPMEVLDTFKRSHKTSVFTCRLGACARATVGFEDDVARLEHERGHTRYLYCEEPGCPHPPFNTPRALKGHVNNHHRDAPVAPRTIRRKQPATNLNQSTMKPPSSGVLPSIRSDQLNTTGPMTQAVNAPIYRPERMQTIPFLNSEEKEKYERGLSMLWKVSETSPRYEMAQENIGKFGKFIFAKIRKRRRIMEEAAQRQREGEGSRIPMLEREPQQQMEELQNQLKEEESLKKMLGEETWKQMLGKESRKQGEEELRKQREEESQKQREEGLRKQQEEELRKQQGGESREQREKEDLRKQWEQWEEYHDRKEMMPTDEEWRQIVDELSRTAKLSEKAAWEEQDEEDSPRQREEEESGEPMLEEESRTQHEMPDKASEEWEWLRLSL